MHQEEMPGVNATYAFAVLLYIYNKPKFYMLIRDIAANIYTTAKRKYNLCIARAKHWLIGFAEYLGIKKEDYITDDLPF
jgi:hypothetical protein